MVDGAGKNNPKQLESSGISFNKKEIIWSFAHKNEGPIYGLPLSVVREETATCQI